jgi:hypothetical protein
MTAVRYGVTLTKGIRTMNSTPASTKDTGRIRLGGGWRLPATKPTR